MKPAFPTTGQRPPLDLILTGGSVLGLGDGALLDRVASGDGPSAGVALDALIRRHGALVARVCRGILGDAQLAEDATQAVFLVLIRRAGSIRDPDRMASRLNGVALRTARAARRQHRRSLTFPIPLDETTMIDPTPDPAQALIRRERAEILHEAINRLPRRYLDPIVLCDLSGLTHAEAAAHLDCPPLDRRRPPQTSPRKAPGQAEPPPPRLRDRPAARRPFEFDPPDPRRLTRRALLGEPGGLDPRGGEVAGPGGHPALHRSRHRRRPGGISESHPRRGSPDP